MMDSTTIHPGPRDASILTLQSKHRSSDIWDGVHFSDPMRPRQIDLHFWEHLNATPLHDRVREYFSLSGLGGVLEAGRIQCDWPLITALLERWRPETHTFHFSFGEATISLQDVEVLYGLPIHGRPVVVRNRDWTVVNYQHMMHRLTGFRPDDADFEGKRLSIKALEAHIKTFKDAPQNASDELLQQHFRAYVLWLFGGILFPDKSENCISIRLLPLLDNVCSIGSYSWGSAVLASLYWSMCRASMKKVKDFCGFSALLQVWAWERLIPIQPMSLPPVEVNLMVYAKKWKHEVDRDVGVRSHLPLYRDLFDGMASNLFNWQPYGNLSERFYSGRDVWMAEVPLIYNETVEYHMPGRVLRQFGFQQGVPSAIPFKDEHFIRDLRFKFDGKFNQFLTEQTVLWEQRLRFVIAEPTVGIMEDNNTYMTWYRGITRTLVGNPMGQTRRDYKMLEGGHEALGTGMHYIYQLAMQMQQPDNLISSQEWGQKLASIAVESLFSAARGTRMSFKPDYDPPAVHCPGRLLKPGGAARSHKRGRGRGGGTRRDAPVDHHLIDEDDVDDPAQFDVDDPAQFDVDDPVQFSPASAAIFEPGDSSYKDLSSSAPVASTSSTPLLSIPTPILWPEDGILTLTWVKDLTLAFDYASRTLSPSQLPSVFPVEAFDCLVQSAKELLHEEDNCVHIDASLGLGGPRSRVVVVGDIHGQFHDLLFLLSDAGFPCEHQFFVFNGDYINRGAWGLETFLLLLAWKVFMPKRVFLLRGNHESKVMTTRFGFKKEVLVKYAAKGEDVYKKCLECFTELPLASIINGHVYTAHGGLFRSMKKAKGKNNRNKVQRLDPLSLGSLKELSEARRHVLDPPYVKNLIPADVLWSNPSQKLGLSENEDRSCGLLWGPDCTDKFLKESNLKLIIRSPEGPDARDERDGFRRIDDGYSIDHEVESGKLVTLFSAPDYPQFQATEDRYRNKGAYIILEPPNFDIPEFHSFEAVIPRPQAEAFYKYTSMDRAKEHK